MSHNANYHNNWAGRLESKGYFPIINQNPEPLGKLGTVVHYDQHKITSITEFRSAQKFVYEYIFHGPIHVKHYKIGNDASLTVAKPIGIEIAKA